MPAGPANVSYPTIAGLGPVVPSFAGGNAIAAQVVSAYVVSEDTRIPGAIVIDPLNAAAFYSGKHPLMHPVPGNAEPPEIKNAEASQRVAQREGPNAWKRRPPPSFDDSVKFGNRPEQKPFARPWNRKFIPPLALFNDASQWVNTLLLNRPMTWWGANGIGLKPPAKSTWLSTPPINTQNLGAGNLNLQLQLGNIMIQQQQLSLSASNFMSG